MATQQSCEGGWGQGWEPWAGSTGLRSPHHYCVCARSCLTLCIPVDSSPPGSSVHEIFQARILERVATSFSRGSFWSRDWTRVSCVSCVGRWILYHCTTWKGLDFFIQSSLKHIHGLNRIIRQLVPCWTVHGFSKYNSYRFVLLYDINIV